MGWRETLSEKARDHIVLGLFALITLLLLAIWRAVPGEVWGKVSEAIPKQVLWALIALELIAIGLLSAFAIDDRRKRKNTPPASTSQPPSAVKPKHYKGFGIMWDTDADPRCPVCLTLMHIWDRFTVESALHEQLKCPKCNKQYELRDDHGRTVLLIQAKQGMKSFIEREKLLSPLRGKL